MHLISATYGCVADLEILDYFVPEPQEDASEFWQLTCHTSFIRNEPDVGEHYIERNESVLFSGDKDDVIKCAQELIHSGSAESSLNEYIAEDTHGILICGAISQIRLPSTNNDDVSLVIEMKGQDTPDIPINCSTRDEAISIARALSNNLTPIAAEKLPSTEDDIPF